MKPNRDRAAVGSARVIQSTAALLAALLFSAGTLALSGESRPSTPPPKSHNSTPPETKEPATAADRSAQELFRGKVVLLRDALARRKIEAQEEFDKQVVLETPEGDLIPIVPDWRGRAFFQDERLRNRDVELVGKRQKGVPYLQVLIVFTFDEKGKRQYTDYYCDTCAFPMYEIKPCECCHGPIRLRFQRRDLPDYIKARLSKAAGPVRRQ
jgi:hypothetical protein